MESLWGGDAVCWVSVVMMISVYVVALGKRRRIIAVDVFGDLIATLAFIPLNI